jgi:hypothetical protein
MSTTKQYRKQIEQSIAKARGLRKAAAPPDPERVRRSVENKKTAAKTRAETLGRLMQLEGPDVVPETALQRLADPEESPVVRLAALKLLQQKEFFSSVAAEWRPAFLDALRTAVDDPKVRAAALEVLSAHKDRQTQAALLEGIRKPKQALVPVDQALRLLSSDIHADVVEVARSLATDQQSRKSKPVFLQALRILGADPASVPRLEQVMANDAHSMDARRLAATALSHLSPASLSVDTPSPKGARRAKAGAKARPKRKDALAKHIETLQSLRR